MDLKIGQKFRWSDRDLWHIIGFLNDGDIELVAVKSWAKHRRNWVYKLMAKESVEWWFAHQKELLA